MRSGTLARLAETIDQEIKRMKTENRMAKRCCQLAAVVALATVSVMSSEAQTPGGAVPAPGAIVSPAKAYDSLLGMFEEEMMGVAKAMPAEKYSFAPSQSIFVEKQMTKYEGVRTFGGMIGHIAQANYYFYGSVGGTKPTADVKAIAAMTSKADLVAALETSFAYAHESIAKMTAEKAFVQLPGEGIYTPATMAAFGIAHGFDHYGQLAEYLRMNGIVPPASVKK